MEFKSQSQALHELAQLCKAGRQSILIEGPQGCGKSYLAKQYASMLEVRDFVQVEPKVDVVKDAIDSCLTLENKVALCIENLDRGVSGAAYAILKFLEEPVSNIYIIVTCQNIRNVPDTIISRSTVVTVGPPAKTDLESYASLKHKAAYEARKGSKVWKAAQSISDVEAILAMDDDQVAYYENLSQLCQCRDNVSSIVWALGHYSHNNSECNCELCIRCIMDIIHTPFIMKCGIECIRDLNQARIAKHAILAKFAFNMKYWE